MSAATGERADGKRSAAGLSPTRHPSVDRVRGLAVLCMVVDHVALMVGGPVAVLLRFTVGRLAMPLFFVTAGRCVGGLSPRHAQVAAIGLMLPLVVGWIDSPNVLLWWAVGAGVVVLGRRWTWLPVVVLVVALGLAANGWSPLWGTSYNPFALVGLMILGSMLPITAWRWGDRLPKWLGWLGRHALPIYVGHVLLLTALTTLG